MFPLFSLCFVLCYFFRFSGNFTRTTVFVHSFLYQHRHQFSVVHSKYTYTNRITMYIFLKYIVKVGWREIGGMETWSTCLYLLYTFYIAFWHLIRIGWMISFSLSLIPSVSLVEFEIFREIRIPMFIVLRQKWHGSFIFFYSVYIQNEGQAMPTDWHSLSKSVNSPSLHMQTSKSSSCLRQD